MTELSLQQQRAIALARARARTTASQTPDGRSVAPGTTAEQAERIPPGMVYDPRTGGYMDAAAEAERMGPLQGASASFIAGAPFVGEGFDEALGRVDSALTGRNPEIAQEVARQSREQFQERAPGTALALEIGGGVVGGLPLAAGAGATLPLAGKTMIGTMGRVGGAGAVAGAAEGAAQGALAGRTAEERQDKALEWGAMGGGVGFLLGAAAPVVGAGVEDVLRRFKTMPPNVIQQEFGLTPRAARVVREALANDDLDTAVKRLAELGDDAMLADAGPATGALLDAAAQTGNEALSTTRRAVDGRAREVAQRLPGALDSILGRSQGVRTAARDIADRTRVARSAAYERAYGSAINYADDAGRRIEDVIARVPDRTLRRAVEEANDAMREAGTTNRQILFDIADDGAVTLREMPNVQQVDFLKRALDDIARGEVDQFGRPTASGARAGRLARDLRNALSDAVPDYRTALRLGGDKLQQDRALDLGRRLLFRNTTVEDVRDLVGQGMPADARRAAIQGLREGIEQNLSNVRRTITDPDVDAREAMALVKEMSSRANREKLSLVLGQARADRLLKELDTQASVLALRGAVSRNSATAIRQGIQRQVADETQPGFIRRTLGKAGNPLEGAQEITETLAGIDPGSMSAQQRAIMEEIAQALTGIRGAEAQRALRAVQGSLQGEPMNEAALQALKRAIVTPSFLAMYQGATQSLTTQ